MGPEDSLATGNYCIKADFEGDANYLPSSATTGEDTIPNPVVVPEMPMETIAALAAITLTSAAMVAFRRKRRFKLPIS